MRTAREIEAEACLMATQATAPAGWTVSIAKIACEAKEIHYWNSWFEAYDKALIDLEAENVKQ